MSIRDLTFPLNIYACLLEQGEGQVDHLHFAVFEEGQASVLQAQQHASDLLLRALPPPCRLLEVGIGLGTTLARLSDEGYAALGITPDVAEVELAHQRHGQRIQTHCTRLEDFAGHAQAWDTMLLHDSAQYIEPLALFAAADRLLRPEGATLVVMDEFALQRRDEADHGLHHLEHFCALAQRQGWRLVQRTELSQQAAPTLDYLLRGTRALRAELMAATGASAEAMDQLDRALLRSRALHEAGVYGYALLNFERANRPAQSLVQVDADNAPAVRDRFLSVFKTPMTAAQWQWKYGQSRGQAVALMQGEICVAHFGGVTRPIRYFGQPALACQVCDVMVEPSANRAIVRRGPLYQVAATFLEHEIGWGLRHLVGYGFPSGRHFTVADRLGLYAEVDRIESVGWPAIDAARPAHAAALVEEADLATGGTVDGLWAEMATAMTDVVLCVRDAAWLRHRYLNHPHCAYTLLLVRPAQAAPPLGLLVLRAHDQHLDLLDMVADPRHFAALVAVARAHAHALGLAYVNCWITASQRHRLADADPAAQTVHATEIVVPANVHTPGPSPAELKGRWFLMSGDADFT